MPDLDDSSFPTLLLFVQSSFFILSSSHNALPNYSCVCSWLSVRQKGSIVLAEHTIGASWWYDGVFSNAIDSCLQANATSYNWFTSNKICEARHLTSISFLLKRLSKAQNAIWFRTPLTVAHLERRVVKWVWATHFDKAIGAAGSGPDFSEVRGMKAFKLVLHFSRNSKVLFWLWLFCFTNDVTDDTHQTAVTYSAPGCLHTQV